VYGSASGTVIGSGGTEIVLPGGVDSGATVSSGGLQMVLGSAVGATVSIGGTQVVSATGRASGTRLNGGFEVVYGSASGSILSSGGAEVVLSGGVDSGAKVNSGGIEIVFSGGNASAPTISGGTLEIMSGGSNGSVTFAASGGGSLLLLAWSQTASGANGSGTLTMSGGGHVPHRAARPIRAGQLPFGVRWCGRHADQRPAGGGERSAPCNDCGQRRFGQRLIWMLLSLKLAKSINSNIDSSQLAPTAMSTRNYLPMKDNAQPIV
jgi:autotransporter passenger strand-loop-strand repeat protein